MTSDDLELLGRVRVASPCDQSWAAMSGDDRVRACAACKHNVYNLSALTAAQARELIVAREGKLCVAMYRRRDGTILTADCPVGLARVRRRIAMAITAVAALLLAFVGMAVQGFGRREDGPPSSLPRRYATARDRVRHVEPLKSVLEVVDPDNDPSRMLKGKMTFVPPP